MALTRPRHTQLVHPHKHKKRAVRFAKNAARFAACVLLYMTDLQLAAAAFAVGEVLDLAHDLF